MPFEKVDTQQVDFPALERDVLALWQRIAAFDRLRAKNAGKPTWSFLDGPITANNPMGVHHAWGRTYKDIYNRYFAMTGHDLRYQNGFDCQGLWVEVEVEKELKLQSKRDIENLVAGDPFASVDRFVTLCKERVDRFARVQTDQSIRLGYWMDWDVTDADWAKPPDERKSYFTMAEENNYTIWAFLKKCHEKGLVYRGYDVMPWCGRCGVGISEQEMKEGYRLVEHRACFVKLPLRGRPGENLLVWTTTPWTLTSNVGAAVNPELTYLQVKLKGEVYYIAKGAFKLDRMASSGDDEGDAASAKKGKRDWLPGVPPLASIEQTFKSKAGKEGYEIVGEVTGATMLGWQYDGPFDDLPAQQHDFGYPHEVAKIVEQRGWSPAVSAARAHRVVSGGGDVTETEGTGIVHTAPGCGQIDFQWGKDNGLPPVAPIGDDGVLLDGFGALTGRNAADAATADAVFEELKKRDRLFAVERYVHRYPHCWRCKTELLYRLVDEWFIHMGPRQTEEGFRGAIMKVVRDPKVTFLPESLNGTAREIDWLRNMGDWMISKKRFWGLALPLWVDEKDPTQFEVIGSREELKARAVEGWSAFEGHSPHRPWIDLVKIRNPRTGNLMSRVSDVGNPWLDAGIVPFSTMGYNKDRDYWKKWFPADFITESFPGQFRNWFYAILAMSTMMAETSPFKVLLGHGLVRDEHGEEMHKSKGNAIPFEEGAEKMGADLMRWMFCRHNPAHNINFGYGPADELRAKFLLKLWNVYAFFCNYARLDGFDPDAPAVPLPERPDIDRWILSDLQGLVAKANESFRGFNVMAFCLDAEDFVDARLSNWYVRRCRRRFWKSEKGSDKLAAYQTLYQVLVTLTKLLAPVTPFLAEMMYRNLVSGPDDRSVHLCDYPQTDAALADADLSADMAALLRLVSLGSAGRNAVKIKVRQPLAELKVRPGDDRDRRAVARFADQIREELNVKAVTLHEGVSLLLTDVKPNLKSLGPKLGPRLKEVQAALSALNPPDLAAKAQGGQPFEVVCPGGPVTLEPTDLWVTTRAPDGWGGAADRNTQVVVDARLTDALRREGMAREVVRLVQDLRKESNLEMEDRITLHLATAAEALQQAVEEHRGTIAAETLTTSWSAAPLGGGTTAKIDGQELTIQLKKA